MVLRTTCVLLVSLVLLCACGGGETPAPSDRSESPPAAKPVPAHPAYTGPAFEFTVEPESSATRFRWSVTVPTGGWTLEYDKARGNPNTRESSILVTLTRPAPGESVTQALETLRGEYRHGKVAFRSSDLLVRLVTKGDDSESVEYALAGTWSQ